MYGIQDCTPLTTTENKNLLLAVFGVPMMAPGAVRGRAHTHWASVGVRAHPGPPSRDPETPKHQPSKSQLQRKTVLKPPQARVFFTSKDRK